MQGASAARMADGNIYGMSDRSGDMNSLEARTEQALEARRQRRKDRKLQDSSAEGDLSSTLPKEERERMLAEFDPYEDGREDDKVAKDKHLTIDEHEDALDSNDPRAKYKALRTQFKEEMKEIRKKYTDPAEQKRKMSEVYERMQELRRQYKRAVGHRAEKAEL
mmetsp:Transcript_19227/g.60910  ORF Transcript_19227/g.60910 Transcript_19227/m.60910 type:complete len:164 (-) Transcript_19227:30-521(-)